MPPKVTKKLRQPIALPLDDDAIVREDVVLGVWPVGPTTLWNQIKAGTFPKPVRIGRRINGWTVGSIRKKLAAAADDDAAQLKRDEPGDD
jgi:predicted DNA-binding transcriptional regulator AlpA